MTKVSIIIPVYNVEKYLKQCLDSVINQTLMDIEVICIDDCSTDGSLEILREYALRDERIIVLCQKNNQGQGVARNQGIEKAKGEYIMFLDPDDWYDLRACERAYKQIKQNNNDVVMFGFSEYIEKKEDYQNGSWRLEPFKDYYNISNINLKTLKNYIKSVYSVTQIYSRHFLNANNIRFSNCRFVEDAPFYIKSIVLAKDISIITDPLYFYRIHTKSSSANFHKNWKDLFNTRYECLSFIDKLDDGKYYIYPYLIYCINSLIYWYNRANKCKFDNLKDFYTKTRTLFRFIDTKYDVALIKSDIDYKNFKHFKNRTWLQCNLLKFFKKIFELKNSSDKRHKIITILGIRLKIKKKSLSKSTIRPIVANRIVFDNFMGKGFGCNPKYIAKEIMEQKLPYEIIWLVKDKTNDNLPKGIKTVNYYSKQAFDYITTSKFIVSNCRLNYFINNGFVKRDNQYYIQTWHGGLAFKKIEKDIEHNKCYNNYLKAAKLDSKYINYLISPSKFDTEILKNCFYYDGEIIEVGYPRNDIFFYDNKEKNKIKNKVYKALNIFENKKIILYAPTFRDNSSLEVYRFNANSLLEILNRKYGSDFVLVVRLHPNIRDKFHEFSVTFQNSVDASLYDDIQELLLVTDVLITDYSSCVWDFCLKMKPAFIFAKDVKEYEQERGFYLPIDNMPFPVARTEDELFDNIINFDEEKYNRELTTFIKQRGCFDSGIASKEIVEIIKGKMGR